MTLNKQVLNVQNYQQFRAEITTQVKVVACTELDVPGADDLVKVYGAVFTTALKQIETMTAVGAKGQDLQQYITVVAGIMQNAGVLAETIQLDMLKQKAFHQEMSMAEC